MSTSQIRCLDMASSTSLLTYVIGNTGDCTNNPEMSFQLMSVSTSGSMTLGKYFRKVGVRNDSGMMPSALYLFTKAAISSG